MAPRSIDPADSVELPQADADENVTLSLGLSSRAAAGASPLPARVREQLERMEEARAALEDALDTPIPRSDARADKAKLTVCWSALSSQLGSHAALDPHPVPARLAAAAALQAACFDESMALMNETDEAAFGRSKRKLDVLEGAGLAHLATLGVPEFATALRASHDAFGAAAGFTVAPAAKRNVQAPMEALRHEIRRYVFRVMDWGDDGPEAQAEAARLLQPWVDWAPRKPLPAADGAAELPPEPGEPPIVQAEGGDSSGG